MQKSCGTGGTVKEGRIEIQGDQRETVACILTDAVFGRSLLEGDKAGRGNNGLGYPY